MRAIFLRLSVFAALLACLPAAGAAPPVNSGAAPSLRAALDSAWQRSPLVRTQAARLDESQALRRQAGSWLAGAPTLGLSQRSDRWLDGRGERETEVSLGASVWLPGQKSAREAWAERGAADAEAQLLLARLGVAGELRESMWEAAAAREALAEKRDHLHHLEELAADVERRVAAGDLARSDALLVRQELLAAKTEVAAARIAAGDALARFQVLTGYADLPPLEPEALHEAVGGEAGGVRVRAARAALLHAEANLAMTTAARQPPPALALSMRRETDPGTLAPNRSIGVALQIPLGSRTRNGPAAKQAATGVANASAQAAQAEAAAAADIALAREQLGIARDALDAATERAAAMHEHTRLFDTAFREGERSLAELLRSRALTHEADVAVRRQRVLLGQAHSRLNQALGILP